MSEHNNAPAVPQGEAVACLVRQRRLRTPKRLAHDGQDHFSEWSNWTPETLKYGEAVTDPIRNSGPECLFEMQPLYAAPATAPAQYKDSTPQLSVGESSFEYWFESYNPANKGDKQRSRDAYAAGMGDPLVAAAPAQGEPFGYFRAEPFGWTDCSEDAEGAIALYERPQEVGLTDEEIKHVCAGIYLSDHPQGSASYDVALARAIIAALRAKGGK